MPPTLPSDDTGERRHTDLVYPPEYEALRPFFDRRTQWSGGNSGAGSGQEVLAYRTLKDHFPAFSPQEIFVIIVTARQLFRSGGDLR